MAFVFKAERNSVLTDNNNDNELGPGSYIPIFDIKNIKLNAKPFNTGAERATKKVISTLGPGSYYQDDTLITYLKNIQNSKISSINDRIPVLISKNEGKINSSNSFRSAEKLGFQTKQKRFVENIPNDGPGPGVYFSSGNNSVLGTIGYSNNTGKVQKMRNREMFSKARIKAIKKSNLMRIPTIPTKETQFGFDILDDGNVRIKQNPDMYKTFSGEKGDTVGPGTYEISPPKNWLKTGTEWSKLRVTRESTKGEKPERTDKNQDNNSLHSTHYTENGSVGYNTNNGKFFKTTRYIIKSNGAAVREGSIRSKSSIDSGIHTSNSFYDKDLGQKDEEYKKIEINLKDNDIRICNVINCKKFNLKKQPRRVTLERALANVTPGPGYYYDHKKSDFYKKIEPEYKQFFGSRLERFYKYETDGGGMGPGEYFKNILNDYPKSPSHFPNVEPVHVFSKTMNMPFAPFLAKTERFKKLLSEIDTKNEPSPATYNLKGFAEKIKETNKNICASKAKFLSTQKRFAVNSNDKWRNAVPGPGSYNPGEIKISNPSPILNLRIYSPSHNWAFTLLENLKNEKNKNKNNSQPKMNITNNKSNNLSNNLQNSSEYSNMTNTKPLISEKNMCPPVGMYNPDIVFSIDYNNKKKVFEARNAKKVAFNSGISKKKKNLNLENLGPGYYYKEKKVKVEQVYPAFHQSDIGHKVNTNKSEENGPQNMYNLDNYYDWNKKSYNVNFV